MVSLKARLMINAMAALTRPTPEREIDELDKVYTGLMLGDRAVQKRKTQQTATTTPPPEQGPPTRQQRRASARLTAKRDRIKQRVDEKKQIG